MWYDAHSETINILMLSHQHLLIRAKHFIAEGGGLQGCGHKRKILIVHRMIVVHDEK